MRDTGAQLTKQAVSGQQERYPILGNTTLRQVPDEDQLPVSRYSAQHKTSRKECSSPNVPKQLDEKKGSGVEKRLDENSESTMKKSIDDPFRDGVYNTDLTALLEEKVPTSSIPSVSVSTLEPRQNRTSFLRARLSAGQIDKSGQTRAVSSTGSTDLAEPVTGPGQRDSLRARKEVEARRSITPPVMQRLGTKASRESIAGNRAPAKFVGGSRRPSHTHRPSSRGSLRDEARAPSPPHSSLTPPSRAAPTRPGSQGVGINVAGMQAGSNSNQRTSSIPISRKSTPNVTTRESDNVSQTHDRKAKSIEVWEFSPKKEARIESRIYNHHSSQDFMNDLEGTPPPRPIVNRLVPFLIDNKDAHVLEAIEESPQHAYQTKRLSVNSPDYGPTLKISPSAEQFIMGSSPRQGRRSAGKKSSRESERASTKDGLKFHKGGTSSTSSADNLPERPSSSQGLTRFGSHMDPAIREKKVKSADVILISPKILDHGSANAVQQLQDPNESSVSIRGSGTSTGTAPYFFDATEELLTGSSRVTSLDVNGEDEQNAPSKEMWISPMKVQASEEVPSSNGRSSVGLRKQPQDHVGKHTTHTERANPFHDSNIEAQDFAEPPKGDTKKIVVGKLPSTPQSTTHGKISPQSGNLPPRSSSRMAPPDWTSNKKSPSPPITAEKVPPPTPPKPKNFAHRQNDLGFQRGHGSSQLDLKNPKSKHDSLRDSAARDSLKSQASLPKGSSVLSNLKGLFHKRSCETEPLRSGTKIKPKVTVTKNGSPYGPYPPISEIHPVHRPTLASANRSKASTPIQKGPTTNIASATPATPSYASPLPTDLSTTTAMAMQILEAARTEDCSPKKERLMKLGEVIVEAITQARDAEKAMEEAKQAARKAEVSHVLCQKSLGDVNRCVQEWTRSQGGVAVW